MSLFAVFKFIRGVCRVTVFHNIWGGFGGANNVYMVCSDSHLFLSSLWLLSTAEPSMRGTSVQFRL